VYTYHTPLACVPEHKSPFGELELLIALVYLNSAISALHVQVSRYTYSFPQYACMSMRISVQFIAIHSVSETSCIKAPVCHSPTIRLVFSNGSAKGRLPQLGIPELTADAQLGLSCFTQMSLPVRS
jgi:hypothetical protein